MKVVLHALFSSCIYNIIQHSVSNTEDVKYPIIKIFINLIFAYPYFKQIVHVGVTSLLMIPIENLS